MKKVHRVPKVAYPPLPIILDKKEICKIADDIIAEDTIAH